MLKKDFRRKKRAGGKLDLAWLGLYMVTKALGSGLYKKNKFVQILNNGPGYWLTMSTVGAKENDHEVHIYNSLYPSVNTRVQVQIASLLGTTSKTLIPKHVNVQKQQGSKMRGHLYECMFAAGAGDHVSME